MIDPGNPFSEAYKDIIDALEERVRHGLEQPARQRFPFERFGTTYELPDTTYAVTRVGQGAGVAPVAPVSAQMRSSPSTLSGSHSANMPQVP